MTTYGAALDLDGEDAGHGHTEEVDFGPFLVFMPREVKRVQHGALHGAAT